MEHLSSGARAIDSLTLREELQKRNELEAMGGVAYIASLLDGVPRVSSVMHYARIVQRKGPSRKLIHSANEILVRGFSNEEDPLTCLNEQKNRFSISVRTKFRADSFNSRICSPKATRTSSHSTQRKELISGIPTGFHQLDNLTSGLIAAELTIVAARPGLGKTSFVLNIAQNAAMEKEKVVGIFSLEMAAQQLVTRMLCSEARVDSHKVRSGYLSKEDWKRLAKTMSKLARAPVFIDDTPGISIIEMRSKARRLKAEHGLDLLIVDYLQLMSGTSASSRVRYENRQQEISTISRSLKGLAKELDIPLIACSQLSRAPEQRRGDHRPQLSDLRESGSIEQDADVVLFLYREDLYNKDENFEDEGIVQLIIGKQRNGPTGVVKLAFIDQWTKFENLASELK